MTTRLTRFGHSCVRLDRDGHALVVDPGTLSDTAAALDGARHVLVTHDHADHLDAVALAAVDVDVHGPQPVVQALASAGMPPERLHVVAHGDALDVDGFTVRVLGEKHAVVHPDVPIATNVGYLVAGVLHPGDAYVDPESAAVDLLLVPIGGPWVKLAEAIDWVRAVRPARVAAIHDAHLSPAGVGLAKTLVDGLTGADLAVLDVGASLDL
jgi:L-ascorbate metabolism protein UlaG (beta-lactamase superfamily)